MIVVSVVLLWNQFRHTSNNEPRRPAAPSIPQEPIALAGAQFLGASSAPKVIIEFSDFECPFCQKFARDTLPALRAKYIASGRVKLVFMHHPLGNHPQAAYAAEASECAGLQGRFWQLHDALFDSTSRLERTAIESSAIAVGVSASEWTACIESSSMGSRIREHTRLAQALKLSGTPAFVIGQVLQDGRVKVQSVLLGAKPLADFVVALDRF